MNADKRVVVVTGATGFIGSNLIRKLVELNFDVHIIARVGSDLSIIKSIVPKLGIFMFNGDIQSLSDYLKDCKAELVIHLASLAIFQHQTNQLDDLIDTNIKFGTQVLESMKIAGVRKIINTGSFAEYFDGAEYNPSGLYAATKKAFEDVIKFYVNAYSFTSITLKLFDVYGPNDPRPKIINMILDAIGKNEKLAMTAGEQYLDLIHIDDVVSAFVTAVNGVFEGHYKSEDIFAVSSENHIQLKNLVSLVGEVLSKDVPVELGGREYRFREIMKPWTDGQTLPGWKAKISLEEGIRSLV